MNVAERVEAKYLKKDVPAFGIGDTVQVGLKVVEGDRERTQTFEGTVIRRHGRGLQSTFTVRRISYGEGVEKVFPIHSPVIQRIEVVRKGAVRRSKLYYLRKRTGKRARVDEAARPMRKSTKAKTAAPAKESPPDSQ